MLVAFKRYKYFNFYKKEILKDIDWITIINDVRNKISDVNVEEMVSLHFRIGDFKNLENHPIMPLEYYISAIKHIDGEDKNIKILYFCEDDDVDFVINNYVYIYYHIYI